MARRLATPASRFGVVRDTVDHLFSSYFHVKATMRAGAAPRWLWPTLRLAKVVRVTEGPYKSRVLCESDSQFDRAERRVHASAIMEVTWDRQGDRDRARKRIVSWPRMTIDYYRVAQTTLREIYDTMPPLESSISLLLDTERAERLEPSSTWLGAAYRREVIHDWHYGLRVRWMEYNAPPSVSKAWETVWDALGAACVTKNLITSCRSVYDFPPRRFAQLRMTGFK